MADRSLDSDGDDHIANYGWDTHDLAFLYSHGGKSCSSEYSSVKMGRGTDQCKLYIGKDYSGNDAWWGGGQSGGSDLNIAIIDTCQSVHKCVWAGGGYRNNSGSFGALLGFHGESYDSSTHTGNFEDFVDMSRYDGLGLNWVTEMTEFYGVNEDECATVVTIGSTSSDRNNIYNNGGLQD